MGKKARMQSRLLSAIAGHCLSKRHAVFCHFVRAGKSEELRWGDIEVSARNFVASYRSVGIPRGGLVLIFLRHVPELYGSFLGAMLGGFRPSFMPCTSPKQDPHLYWSSHGALLERIRPAVVVADRATLAEMQANGLNLDFTRQLAIEDVGAGKADWEDSCCDDIALLQHSSGTTGLKKGVALTYQAIESQLDAYAEAIGLRPDDVIVSWLPLYHDMGLIACFLLPLYRGVPIVHVDSFEWLARPDSLFELISKFQGTLAWLPNFAFEYLVTMAGRDAGKYQLGGIRAFINCSETCRPSSFDRFATAFAPSHLAPEALQCCYAMAETVFAVSQTRIGKIPRRIWCNRTNLERGCRVSIVQPDEGDRELIECGSPIKGIAVWAVDEQRHRLPEGHVGELVVSGDFLFSGYNEELARTEAQLADDCYFTRDLGFVLEDAVYVLGRVDDLIIVNGRNIYAHEIEDLLAKVDGLKRGRSVAVPIADERSGTQGLMIIAEREKESIISDLKIRSEVLNRVFSVVNVMPKSIHLVDEGWLVKTTSGKISREMNAKKIATEDPRK